MKRCEAEVESYPENSIVGDSKDTKESTIHVRSRKRETWDLWLLVVTCSQRL